MIVLEHKKRETGREYALRNLKENIIHLKLEPGAKISENEIATLLGLSRTPVREALIELSKVNIVEIYPQKGSNIALIDFTQVEEAYFMRSVLECAAVELCCDVAKEGDIKALKENVQLQEYYLSNKDDNEILKLDNQFHKIIFDIVNKPQVHTLIRNFSIHLDRMRYLTLGDISPETVVRYHKAIASAIEKKNGIQARNLMKEHISNYQSVEKAVFKRFPHYFINQSNFKDILN